MESMTGYAFVEKTTQQFSFSIEIKSLNSKYLETYINLPRVLRNEENEFESILKKRFGRGKLELNIEIYDWVDTRPVSVNKDLLKKYYTEVKKATNELKIENSFSIDALISLEGVIQRNRSVITEKTRSDVLKAFEMTIEKNILMRKNEGKATKRDIENSIRAIALRLSKIEKLSKDLAKLLYEKLKSRIESLMESKVEDTRLYSEIAILADKQDINEEIIRLKDHMKKFKEVMLENEQVGKRLDFLAQELFREINTIASKSNSSEISHLVVDIKNYIDKIREQCRNIL